MKILKIGHRGAKGYEPENTLLSFQKAIDLGVDMIEMDVYMCKSGEVVCIHDQKLDRTTNGNGYVHKKTLEQLKKLDAGKGEKIPTLAEALDLIDQKVKVNIELKGKKTLHHVVRLIDRYVREKGWNYDNFLISTFKRSKLRKIATSRPKVKLGALLAYRPTGFVKFAGKINAFSVHINVNIITKKLVDEAHNQGILVYVWTVNEVKDIKEVIDMGVDGIFSDFPDRIK